MPLLSFSIGVVGDGLSLMTSATCAAFDCSISGDTLVPRPVRVAIGDAEVDKRNMFGGTFLELSLLLTS